MALEAASRSSLTDRA